MQGSTLANVLMMHTGKHLTRTKGLSEAKVDKICESTEKIVNSHFITGIEAMLRASYAQKPRV